MPEHAYTEKDETVIDREHTAVGNDGQNRVLISFEIARVLVKMIPAVMQRMIHLDFFLQNGLIRFENHYVA